MMTTSLQHLIAVLHKTFSSHHDLIERVMAQMGAERIKLAKREYRCTCPIHRGKDPNFAIWFHNDVVTWKCLSHACGRGPIHTLPMVMYGMSEPQAVSWLAQIAGIATSGEFKVSRENLDQIDVMVADKKFLSAYQDNEFEVMPEYMVKQAMENRCDYFLKRQYSPEVLERFEVGFIPANTWVRPDPDDASRQQGWFEDRVAIPIRMPDGRLIGFSGRRIDGVENMKYKVLPGTRKGMTLYGLHLPEVQEAIRKTRTIIFVEGYPDVFRAWMHGVFNVTSFMGTDPSVHQMRLIEHLMPSKSVFYYDADEAGQMAAAKYRNRVQDISQTWNAVPPVAGVDPGELIEREVFLEPLMNATQAVARGVFA